MNYEKKTAKSSKYTDKKKPVREKPVKKAGSKQPDTGPELVRLNKFIANAGVCSRREADVLIESGIIKVNGKTVKDLGTKISPNDKVQYDSQTLKVEKKYYVLLNKPKDYITTTDDPYSRRTVMFLVKNACHERIYPVGRLDKNTTGILLLTNDGELAKKLTHPKHNITKIYHVKLNKNVSKGDIVKISNGINLDDGLIKVDDIAFVKGADNKREIGVEIHSGKNRIIKRIFESLGYKVLKLDRVDFAGLTKKDIPRGKWRHLSNTEISFLKMK